jgi:hypothetical protein
MMAKRRKTPLDDFWRPIKTKPAGFVILYHPAVADDRGRNRLGEWIVISDGNYPRHASHWMPVPNPPKGE